MVSNRSALMCVILGTVMLMLSLTSAHGQQPVIRGRVILQQIGENRVIQLRQPGVFGNPTFRPQTQKSEPPVYPEAPPLPSRPPIEEAKLEQLIFQLSSDSFRERVEATKVLKTGGERTVRRLVEVLHSESPEAARRALSILEELFLCEDELASLAADDVLMSLVEMEESPLTARAEEILSEHSLLRTQRATRELEVLGAHIEYRNDILLIDDVTGELYPRIGLLRFDRNWKGGVQGLKLLSRIEGLESDLSQIYLVLNCPVSREDFFDTIKREAPRIDPSKINVRSKAQLGITFDSNFFSATPGVMVTGTPEGYAAAEAGIEAGDLLIKINEFKLSQPLDLTTELEKYAPGDEVEMTLKRNLGTENEKEMTVTVKLKGWEERNVLNPPPSKPQQQSPVPGSPPRPE